MNNKTGLSAVFELIFFIKNQKLLHKTTKSEITFKYLRNVLNVHYFGGKS